MNVAQGEIEQLPAPTPPRRAVPMILRDVLLYGVAGYIGVSLFRFLLKVQLLWERLSQLDTGIGRHEWISLFILTSRDSFNDVWANASANILFGPFVETLTIVVLWRIGRWLHLGSRTFVLTAAVIWGWIHVLAKGDEYGSAFVFFCTMLSGAFLAAIYAKYRIAYGWGIAFLACAATHSLYNALIIGANFVGMKLVS